MFKPDTCCSLAPCFEVQEGQLPAFKALARQLVELARTESGCLHYAFSFNGNIAHCREGYANAEAVLAHLRNVGELVGKLLQTARLTHIDVHAPAEELEKLREPMAALGAQFFVLEPGIRRVEAVPVAA